MKLRLFIAIIITGMLTSCFNGNVRRQMANAIRQSQKYVADQDFKHAIGYIEIYKLRFGKYPESLYDLKYIGAFDSTIFHSVQYEKIVDGYKLDLTSDYTTLKGKTEGQIILKYPDEFWQGLGCLKSNLKNN